MISAIPSFNLKLFSNNFEVLSDEKYNKVTWAKENNDIFIKSQESPKISFTGYKRTIVYGTQEERDALSYRIQLTPEKIKQNMQNAPSVEAGIKKNYNLLAEEVGHFSKALASAVSISNDYSTVSAGEYKKIRKMAPKYSRVPVLGLLPQWESILTGSFKNTVEACCYELTDDINGLIHTHIYRDLESFINRFNDAKSAFIETLSPIDKVNKAAYLKVLEDTNAKLNKNIAIVCNVFNQQRKIAFDNKAAIIESQHKSQALRTTTKTVRNLLGGGLIHVSGLDDIIIGADIPILSKVMGADLIGNAVAGVSDTVIKSIASVTLESVRMVT